MWLKKFFILLLTTLMIMSADLPAYAQDGDDIYEDKPAITLPDPPKPQAGEPDIGAAISPLRWGQTAPFTGILLSPEATATVIAEINANPKLVKLEVEKERKVQQAQCEAEKEHIRITLGADKKILQAQLDARRKEIEILTDRLEKVEDSQPNMLLWVGGSFLGGVLVTVGVTLGVSYAVGAGN